MEDVQSYPSESNIPIDRVGIRKFRLPMTIDDQLGNHQHTVATAELGVSLSAEFKGTHMSRFVDVLKNWDEHISYKSLSRLLEQVKERLQAQKAYVKLSFPYFLTKSSPVTKQSCLQDYECGFSCELQSTGKLDIYLELCVPVMTVCPCSKAISDEGAHSQRADIRMKILLSGHAWIEEFITLAERCGSSPTYPLLKREDEKFVTEDAFSHPQFVEDVVRQVAIHLNNHPHVSWFSIEVESYESIHGHNAFARIEKVRS